MCKQDSLSAVTLPAWPKQCFAPKSTTQEMEANRIDVADGLQNVS